MCTALIGSEVIELDKVIEFFEMLSRNSEIIVQQCSPFELNKLLLSATSAKAIGAEVSELTNKII